MPATASAARRGERLLRDLADSVEASGILVARHPSGGGERMATRDLARLAREHRAPLILMPPVPDLADAPVAEALEAASTTMESIVAIVRRSP
jgi:hypothetical protein